MESRRRLVSVLSDMFCVFVNLALSAVPCSQSQLVVVQTLGYLQLFLVLKFTMKQETSTNLHKILIVQE